MAVSVIFRGFIGLDCIYREKNKSNEKGIAVKRTDLKTLFIRQFQWQFAKILVAQLFENLSRSVSNSGAH